MATQEFIEALKEADKSAVIDARIDTKIADKVDKVSGKSLSKNDYTDAEKAKSCKCFTISSRHHRES